jgi:formylglycine-generating enzyme required for sulfatase activity
MLRSFTFSLAALALVVLAACKGDRPLSPCTSSADCNLVAGGQCLGSPLGPDLCAYPDSACGSGLSWGEFGGDLSGECITVDVDASVDTDGRSTDASTDAPSPSGMVFVPAGPFERGCDSASDDCANVLNRDELPRVTVTVSAFWIDLTEVTQVAYQACITAGACTAPARDFDPVTRGDFPVGAVSHQQAIAFCTWAGKRLPTEAEWEKAARGAADSRIYPWGNDAPSCALAWYAACPEGTMRASAVGTHPAGASPYGVQDMAGNAMEWVSDWYGVYSSTPTTDPQGPPTGIGADPVKVFRGGGWNVETRMLRSSDRDGLRPATTDSRLGFRCVKT